MASGDLAARLRGEIRRDGPLSFARFMELALYDPDGGYYARGPQAFGPDGDFFTAVDTGEAFGRCLARHVARVDAERGPFDPFHVIEFGAGRGLLARDLISCLEREQPQLAARLRYLAVERSAALRREIERQAPRAEALAPESLRGGYRGCVLAVELFDALPVHRLRRREGALVEVRVSLAERREFIEVELPADERLAAHARRYGAARLEGSEAEVCLQAGEVLGKMAGCLERGTIAIVDYGYPAEELYAPRRFRGTLMAYRAHAAGEDYLAHVGEQDLTAHVNFSALEDRARDLGLEVLEFTTQERFLMAHGLAEVFEDQDPDNLQDPRRARARLQALQLIHPAGMGRTFRVLTLGVRP